MNQDISNFVAPGTEFVPLQAIILSDLIGQHLGAKIIKTESESFSGCTVNRLTKKIQEHEMWITDYKSIALLIGTCDISGKDTWNQFKRTGKLPPHSPKPIPQIIANYTNLLTVLTHYNPTATVVICSILPRPYDYVENRIYLKSLNLDLQTLSKSNANFRYLNIAKHFIHCGMVVDDLYLQDKLHLSPKGNVILVNVLNSYMGQVIQNKENL